VFLPVFLPVSGGADCGPQAGFKLISAETSPDTPPRRNMPRWVLRQSRKTQAQYPHGCGYWAGLDTPPGTGHTQAAAVIAA
jgi:hypothetical protein